MKTEQTILTTESLQDIARIQAIAYEVWPPTYSAIISPQQIAYMLRMMYSTEVLQRQMKEEGHEFILVQHNGEYAGFAGYAEEAPGLFKLHKLYVLTSKQGHGLGKLLLEDVCKRAIAKGGSALLLQVNKNNKAKDFYLSNGFRTDHELVLDIGGGFVMDDYVMRRELT